MKQSLAIAVTILVAAILPHATPPATDHGTSMNARGFMLQLDATAVNFSECGEENNGCSVGATEHEIKASSAKEYAGLHECMPPAGHGGPACTISMMDRLDASPDVYAAWLRTPESNVRLNEASKSLILLDCEGEVGAVIPLREDVYARLSG